MTDAPALTLENVSRQFGRQWALREVSLRAEAGSFTVLLGPSGSGKSTLLRLLAGTDRLTSGEISFGSQVVAGAGVHVPPHRRELAMVFQDYALWPHMTVRQNVAFALRRRRRPSVRVADAVERIVARVGLSTLLERYPSELSGGQQQRVALARALVAQPGLLLFDEPLSNLDADLRERLRMEIATLVREAGSTVVYITHDQAEAFALADRVGVLDAGELVQFAPPEQIYAHPASPFVARFTGLAGELPVQDAQAVSDSEAVVHVVSVRVRARLHRHTGGLGTRSAADSTLLVRPAAVHFATGNVDDAIPGQVLDVAFRGHGYDHLVELRDGHRLASVFAERPRARGEAIHVRIDPNGCHLFAARGTTDRPQGAPPVESNADALAPTGPRSA